MINSTEVNIVPISSLKWSYDNLQSNYNTLQIDQKKILFSNNITLPLNALYTNAKDITINNGSLIMLSDNTKVNSIFKEEHKIVDRKSILTHSSLSVNIHVDAVTTDSLVIENGISAIKTVIHSESYTSRQYLTVANNSVVLTDRFIPVKNNIFTFLFEDNYVVISNLNSISLTDSGGYLNVSMSSPAAFVHEKFNYILNDISIILFQKDSAFNRVLTFNADGSTQFITLTSGQNIPTNSIIYINYLEDLHFKKSIEDSFIAKYSVDTLSASNSIELDSDVKHYDYNQDYLINIPHNNFDTMYINSLKNYYTSQYEYSFYENNFSNRKYTNLFTGTNQKNGHSNIYLNFVADTTKKIFKKDTDTVFHYPATAPLSGIALSSTNLFEEGAIAGKNPFTSDRIRYSRRDYRELNIPTLSADIADNSWLYSWLSAGDNGTAIWMDRFYRGAKYNFGVQDYYTINDPLVVDLPSTMIFYPNRVYSYFHQGQDNIKTYTSNFDYISDSQNTKLLEINDWSTKILNDTSFYKNNGSISSNSQILSKDKFYLDGKNYIIFPASKSLAEDKQLTIGFWLNFDNWNKIEGSQIFGNFDGGGLGLFNKQSIPSAFITVYDNLNGYIYNYNSNLKLINEQNILPTSTGSNYIIRTTNQSFWIISSDTLEAVNFDLNNNKINSISLPGIKNITQVEIDGAENIYVVDGTMNAAVVFDTYTASIIQHYMPLVSTSISSFDSTGAPILKTTKYNRIEIISNYNGPLKDDVIKQPPTTSASDSTINNYIIGVCGDHSVTDSLQNIWSSIGINLYKNKTLYASIGKIIQITCDSAYGLWILHDLNKITKINVNTNTIEFTKTIASAAIDTNTKLQTRFINFISLRINNKEEDFAIIVDNREKSGYILDLDGTIYNSINFLSIPSTFLSKRNLNRDNINLTSYGDFTGYQYQRKFNTKNQLVWKIAVTENSNSTAKRDNKIKYLPIDVFAFDAGWHYFSLTFDHERGKICAYVNGLLLNSITFDHPFQYKIAPSVKSFCIGAITTEQGLLNDTIGINDKHKVIGYISNLHIYKYAFDIYDIKCLFKGSREDLYKDLVWNIKAGSRNYIEQIERFFMHKMPGNKSKYFNLRIKNFNANEEQKTLLNQAIQNSLKKIIPADTVLREIKWD